MTGVVWILCGVIVLVFSLAMPTAGAPSAIILVGWALAPVAGVLIGSGLALLILSRERSR